MSITGYWGKATSHTDLLRDWSRGVDIRVRGQVLEGRVSLEEKLRRDRVVRLRESGNEGQRHLAADEQCVRMW